MLSFTYILTWLLLFVFAAFLAYVGQKMLRTRSWKKLIDDYEKNPRQAGWIENYFFGLKFSTQRKIHHTSLQALGDAFVTLFYRASGAFFILVAIAIYVAGLWLLISASF